MCVVTVHAAPFIELYNSNFSERYGVHKLAGTSNATATLHWFWHNTYGWQYLENPPIQFNITRDTSEKTYTLNYYKNTTDTVTNMPEPNPQTEKSNTGMVTFTVSSAIPAREGYNFLGWNGKPDATEPTVMPGNTITTPRETTNLYAVWESKTPPPEIPGDQKPNIEEANAKIRVQCIEYPSKHNPYKQNYRILPGSYDDLGWDRTEYGYIYSIRLNRAKYIAQFDQEIGRPHTDTEPNKETRINWRWENDAWHLIDGPDGVTADIKVKCAETPVKPEKPTALDGSFAIVCKNNEATHAYKADYIATPSQYTISDVQMDNQGYYVTATVTVAPNLVAYNTATRVEHRLVNEQDATLTITFRYDTEATGDGNRKWQQQGDLPVVEVICKPKAPTADELKKLEMAVQVKCVVDASQQHTAAYGLLGECDVDYFVFEPRQEGDDWLCDISYYPERYVAEFNTTFQNLKHVQNDEKIVPVTLIWAGGSWQIKTQGRVHVTEEYTVTYTDGVDGEEVFADQVYSDLRKDSTTPAFNGTPTRTGYTFAGWEPEVAETVTQTVIYVAMWTPVEPKAPTAEELEKLEMAVQVKCVVDDSQQHTEAYGLLGEYDEDYFVGEPRKDGDGWLCDISYYPERYVAAFNTTFQNLKHVQNDEKIVPVTLIWAGGSWQIKTQGRVHVTEEYTVTYTDGVDGEEVFADQVYSDLRKDSTTPAFNGTPTRTGYTFAGWEPEVAATVTQTVTYVAKWEKKTYKVVAKLYVNGKPAYYQNEDFYTYKVSGLYGENIDFDTIKAEAVEQAKQIKKASASYTAVILEDHEPNPVCTTFGEHQPGQATHYVKVNVKTEENVVIFQSFEGKTDLTKLHTTTAPYGTNVVEFLNGLGLDLDVAGYTLDTAEDGNTNWYKKDSPKWTFGANDTINGWTNVLLKYTVTPHNIYAYARLNSYFAPLTTSEFDTPVTLNEATLSRLGLGSYNSLGYISIGSFTFDAMPLTSDLYFGDDAELSAVAEKLATDIALETGVSDKIAEKIAWTALYKTVNEEDMEPGYPAEAGYQLSGNLNLASVTFRAGAENVENMPAVNYTYDDGAIDFYDFYFAGDTITLPTTEPTREGYSFKGWSVEVIPAENDADHLDADGADDAADETLLKAGDTYTITAGGVIFTAQWEKKTFTVKYYLPDETGAWVEKKMDTVDSVDYATYSLWTPNAEDGYEFSGWYQKPADIGVKAKVEKLYMAKEWKLYGKFTPIEYTIQYVYNDGKATSTNPTTYTVESDTITLADATGADWGKTFLEWHDENGQKITEIPTGSTGDRVITAYWNWPVHLHYLDKDNNEIESATLYVSELEPGACVLPTGEKTGYDFDGWYEAKKDIGTASHKLNALSIAKKWELYGRYTAKTDVSYTVKYLREGDNKVLAPEKVVTDQTFDTEVTEQAADVVGYTPDAPSKTMILDEYNKVLTFSYSANTYDYTVRHIKQLPDGSYDEANAEVETLSGKFEALAAVTAKDYGSHYPTNDADTKQNIKIEEGLTIDVKYDLDEHTLTFETNGGSAINPVTVRHGNAVARPADPTKDKYTFIGWYADPEFTEEYDFATVLEADKTIYAKFELTSTPIGDIYVRYDVLHIKQLPDGTYDLANAEVEHLSAKKDTTVTAVAKNYSATHHFFNSKLGTLTGTAIQPYMGVDGKPVYTILSVYYDLDFHTLTFDTMGGSKIAPETVRHGLTVAKPKDPVNGGFLFDGWYTDKTYRTPYNFATPLTQDTTIYAKWFLIVLPGVTVKKNTPKLNTADHFAYVQGYPDGTVKPAGNITRAETAAILFRLMDDASRKTYYSTKSGFRDVASGSWYNTYVATLNNAGVITDSSNGYFRPNEAITRAELAAMLAKFSETTGAANYFNDVSAKYWAANAIAICAKLGWITGYPDGTFRPDKNVTRAELMAMINRATGRAPKSADAFLPGMKTWSDNTADKWYYLDVQEATNSHSYTVKGSETWTALTSDPNWSLYE
ncbi:MAG: InlB B-repeat-containing protein [Oscillospiraceae bacterium]